MCEVDGSVEVCERLRQVSGVQVDHPARPQQVRLPRPAGGAQLNVLQERQRRRRFARQPERDAPCGPGVMGNLGIGGTVWVTERRERGVTVVETHVQHRCRETGPLGQRSVPVGPGSVDGRLQQRPRGADVTGLASQ